MNLSLASDALLGLLFQPFSDAQASWVVVGWVLLKKPGPSNGPMLKERAHQTVRADQESEIHRGPKGGFYRIDSKGRKVYLKASDQPNQGKPSRAKRRRTKTV